MRTKTLFLLMIVNVFNIHKLSAGDLNNTYSLQYDKATIPERNMIIDSLGAGGPYASGGVTPQPGTINGMVCASSGNSINGACTTQMTMDYNKTNSGRYSTGYGEDIKLTMKSVETGVQKEIIIKGVSVVPCAYTVLSNYYPCVGQTGTIYEMKVSLYILNSQIRNLPIGNWEGTLVMYQRRFKGNAGNVGVWTMNIKMGISDSSLNKIIFPASLGSDPVVNINLTNHPGTGNNINASGKANLDMCLYDGGGLVNNKISLVLKDTSAVAPNGQFSIYREGGDKNDVSNRLDYSVNIINPATGATQEMKNGIETILKDINQRKIQRQIIMPGGNGVTYCVPVPITLSTPSFKLADKQNGRYSGVLSIIYTPSTN
ncbi:CfaE/CblD family pilus tip adhesin [Cedecea sp. MMO-103]|uniref:CfaE/CblD family pilus tip adhesin n=1 Tax=Cedecea sp. MMO-103 TaxID=3081238 RepID=UPI003016D9A9